MESFLEVVVASKLFFNIMVSFAFFIGIILMAAPEAFQSVDNAMKKEYGIKKRLVPKLEDASVDAVDKFVIRNRVVFGVLIAIASFSLLIIFP